MSNKQYEFMTLQWDSDFFGVSSARVNLNGAVEKMDQEKIIEFCKGYDFVSIYNYDNVKENNYWIGNRTNAFLVDLNIQFQKNVVDKPNYQDGKSYVRNELTRNEQILDIASKSFKYSRFFNDPDLSQEKANNIYLHWTECAFGQDDKFFVIAERGEKVAGYILFSKNANSYVVELIAVDENYQGQKVGKSLISTMESFVKDQGMDVIRVGTQVNNILAAQFYYAAGFKYVSCSSVYHLWSKNRIMENT